MIRVRFSIRSQNISARPGPARLTVWATGNQAARNGSSPLAHIRTSPQLAFKCLVYLIIYLAADSKPKYFDQYSFMYESKHNIIITTTYIILELLLSKVWSTTGSFWYC
jgi:hypothetical protein